MGGVPSHSLGRCMAGGQGMGEGMKRKGVFLNKEIPVCNYCWDLEIKKKNIFANFSKIYYEIILWVLKKKEIKF